MYGIWRIYWDGKNYFWQRNLFESIARTYELINRHFFLHSVFLLLYALHTQETINLNSDSNGMVQKEWHKTIFT